MGLSVSLSIAIKTEFIIIKICCDDELVTPAATIPALTIWLIASLLETHRLDHSTTYKNAKVLTDIWTYGNRDGRTYIVD
jgi:hypothetical protein